MCAADSRALQAAGWQQLCCQGMVTLALSAAGLQQQQQTATFYQAVKQPVCNMLRQPVRNMLRQPVKLLGEWGAAAAFSPKQVPFTMAGWKAAAFLQLLLHPLLLVLVPVHAHPSSAHPCNVPLGTVWQPCVGGELDFVAAIVRHVCVDHNSLLCTAELLGWLSYGSHCATCFLGKLRPGVYVCMYVALTIALAVALSA